MSVMHVGQSDAQVQRWLRWDEESRQLITGAMLGCQERASMKKGESRIVLDLGSGSARDRDYLMQRFDADYSGIEVVKDAADRTAHLGVRHLAIEEMPAELHVEQEEPLNKKGRLAKAGLNCLYAII
jgi:hypothetical protein